MEVIKAVATQRYTVELSQAKSGAYYIKVDTYSGDDMESVMSDAITDYKLATHVFDAKLNELEGH